MHIDTPRYLITTDAHNFILQLKRPRQDSSLLKDKSKVGELVLDEKRFYPSLVQLFSGLSRLTLLSAEEVSHFEEIKELLREIKQEAKHAAHSAQ